MHKHRPRLQLRAEDEILRAISVRAPLSELLNRICAALDCQIGNVVSLIYLPGEGATALTSIVESAQLFGLYTFCSADVLNESREALGSLETYSCLPRCPTLDEFQLIERATHLAATAIKLHKDVRHHGSGRIRDSRSVPERAPGRPAYIN
jgi:hypothetical protein